MGTGLFLGRHGDRSFFLGIDPPAAVKGRRRKGTGPLSPGAEAGMKWAAKWGQVRFPWGRRKGTGPLSGGGGGRLDGAEAKRRAEAERDRSVVGAAKWGQVRFPLSDEAVLSRPDGERDRSVLTISEQRSDGDGSVVDERRRKGTGPLSGPPSGDRSVFPYRMGPYFPDRTEKGTSQFSPSTGRRKGRVSSHHQ